MKIFIDVDGYVGAPLLRGPTALANNEKSLSSGLPSNRAPNLLGKQAGIPAKERRKIGTHVASKYYWR